MSIYKKLANNYVFNDELPRDARVLNVVCLFGFLAACAALIARVLEQLSFIAIGGMILMLVSIAVLFFLANRFKVYKVATWFTLIALGDVLFPVEFFASGGADGGMSAYFVLSITLIFFLLRGRVMAILLTIHIAVIILCFAVGHFYPELVTRLTPEQNIAEHLQAILVSGLFIGLVVKYQNAIYNSEKIKAEQASKTKSEFLATMSHEMRTPMNAIIGMTTIAKAAEELEKKDYALGKIEAASAHLLGVINDILDMSKIEAAKFELSFTEFSFVEIVKKVETVIKFPIDEKHQFFITRIDDKIPNTLISDDQRLTQVIINLLSNAIKFTPDKGTVALDAVLLDQSESLYEIQIEITDTGIGLSEEQIDGLFDPFKQADSSTSRKFGGTGLGLSISKSIVQMLGGKIWVKSRLGKGSKFLFTFRAQAGTSALASSHADATGQLAPATDVNKNPASYLNKRILLAEDIEINREIVLALLEDTGIQIDCASNGQEALAMFTASPGAYDIILMDLMMPEMDGYESTRNIRSLEVAYAKDVPIVAMTANVFKEDVEKCLAAGMNDHIGKPIDHSILMAKLAEYLDSSET